MVIISCDYFLIIKGVKFLGASLRPEYMAREMVQWLGALIALAEEGGLVLSTHTGQTAHNSGSKRLKSLLWPLGSITHVSSLSFTDIFSIPKHI